MDWTTTFAIAGCFCFGSTIGWLVRFFIERYRDYDAKILSSTISVFFGGCVVAFFKFLETNTETNVLLPASFYFIGLPCGLLVLYPIVRFFDKSLENESDAERARHVRAQASQDARHRAGLKAMEGVPNAASESVDTADR